MCSNERGSWAIYRHKQPIRFKLCGSPCVSSHGSGRMHGDTSCSTWLAACLSIMQDDTTPSTCLDSWPGSMKGDTTSSTCLAAWPGCMHSNTSCLADPPRAPQVYLHVQVACTAAPPASLDTHTARKLPPRPEHTHQATSSFSFNSADFGLSGEFLSRNQSQIFFYARSDGLSIFNKPHLDSDLEEKYFSSFRLLRKIP